MLAVLQVYIIVGCVVAITFNSMSKNVGNGDLYEESESFAVSFFGYLLFIFLWIPVLLLGWFLAQKSMRNK
jgi:NADH:ubiquinone oxidoreductase subunit 6 (subunit J)